jgi:3-hydroxyacyl-CoA dehydrogenase/enoyl-CoA hydratase/3-hydroxybutyryl-CoA epimerase
MAAQPFSLEGRLFGPREAFELGSVQGLANDAAQLRSMALDWIAAHPHGDAALGPQGLQDAGRHAVVPEDRRRAGRRARDARAKTRGLYPRRSAILETMVEGAQVDYDTRHAHREPQAREDHGRPDDRRTWSTAFFFNLNAIKSGKSGPRDGRMEAGEVGVLGAGMMGAGIAHACASRGLPAC